MKPTRIILIRHGECHGNTDESRFATVPDYTIELTENGIRQAVEAGEKLKQVVGEESMYFYVSPFWWTRSTFENIVRAFPRNQFQYNEEPRLREQEWGVTCAHIKNYNSYSKTEKSTAPFITVFRVAKRVPMSTTASMTYLALCIETF